MGSERSSADGRQDGGGARGGRRGVNGGQRRVDGDGDRSRGASGGPPGRTSHFISRSVRSASKLADQRGCRHRLWGRRGGGGRRSQRTGGGGRRHGPGPANGASRRQHGAVEAVLECAAGARVGGGQGRRHGQYACQLCLAGGGRQTASSARHRFCDESWGGVQKLLPRKRGRGWLVDEGNRKGAGNQTARPPAPPWVRGSGGVDPTGSAPVSRPPFLPTDDTSSRQSVHSFACHPQG